MNECLDVFFVCAASHVECFYRKGLWRSLCHVVVVTTLRLIRSAFCRRPMKNTNVHLVIFGRGVSQTVGGSSLCMNFLSETQMLKMIFLHVWDWNMDRCFSVDGVFCGMHSEVMSFGTPPSPTVAVKRCFLFPHTSWKLLMYNDKLLHFFMGGFFPTVLDFKPQLLENGCPSANQNTFAGFDYIMLVFPMKWSVCVYIEMLHFWSVLFASKCYQSQTGSLSPLNVMCTLLGWWFNCQS